MAEGGRDEFEELGYADEDEHVLDRSDNTPPDTQATKYPFYDTAALEAAVELINLREQRVEHFYRTPVIDQEWLETNQIRAEKAPREKAQARSPGEEEPQVTPSSISRQVEGNPIGW